MTETERARLPGELRAWLLRAPACALPSFGLALFAKFDRIEDILAMLTGIASWGALFAVGCSLEHVARYQRFVKGLRQAAWIKAAATPLGPVVMGFCFWLIPQRLAGSFCFTLAPELVTGSSLVHALERPPGAVEAYLTTLLMTLLQGTVIAAQVGILALALTWVGRSRRRSRRRRARRGKGSRVD